MALPEKIDLRIVTPERQLFSGLVDHVTVPSTLGYLGILPGHAPLLAELGIGNISYEADGRTEYITCAWGFLEVLPDRVIVLAQTAEVASEIDAARAEQAKLRAERRLASKNPDVDFTRAQLALMRAAARLDAVSRMRHRPVLLKK
ncbi:MAG: F0F1 ATP synthase subunit epsilon [Acidobacteria bacterium]|nr:F0F1 ATP synthase subunit epsilon [Acidobacteriota bacterium]